MMGKTERVRGDLYSKADDYGFENERVPETSIVTQAVMPIAWPRGQTKRNLSSVQCFCCSIFFCYNIFNVGLTVFVSDMYNLF